MLLETAVNIFLFITKLVIPFSCMLIKGGCGFQRTSVNSLINKIAIDVFLKIF